MKTLDKKQIPQFAALCVLTAGLFGYFVIKIVTPGSAAAGTRPALAIDPSAKPAGMTSTAVKNGAVGTPAAGTPATGTSTQDASATDDLDAPPPSPGMRNPFTVGYTEPQPVAQPVAASAVPKLPPLGQQIASIKEIGPAPVSFPGAPPLPTSLSSFSLPSRASAPSLPAGPAAPPLPPPPPAWTVTGVLQSATEKIAVLRSGDARRIVHSGDFVDSTYRVVAVSRTSVVLRHGTAFYQLPLGGPKDASGKPSAAPTAAAPVTAPLPTSTAVPVPGSGPVPAALPASASDLAGQLEQALPPSLITDAHHG